MSPSTSESEKVVCKCASILDVRSRVVGGQPFRFEPLFLIRVKHCAGFQNYLPWTLFRLSSIPPKSGSPDLTATGLNFRLCMFLLIPRGFRCHDAIVAASVWRELFVTTRLVFQVLIDMRPSGLLTEEVRLLLTWRRSC